jgi:NAD+ kinase
MRFAIYSRLIKDKDIPAAQELFDVISELEGEAIVYDQYFEALKGKIRLPKNITTFSNYHELKAQEVDVMITMGGDGTILDTLLLIREMNIPVAGINLGRLGFLSNIEREKIRSVIQEISKGAFSVDERSLLQIESNIPIFQGENFALNDCTLLKRDTSSMIIVHTYINGEYLNSYWADGIVIATPTGSTGYSLSCGGPIILPNSNNFIITAVAPHNLTVRSIVIADDSVLSFQVEGRAENFLCTLDSRFETITSQHRIAVRKADFNFKLIKFPKANFLSTIRNKLSWGSDMRN